MKKHLSILVFVLFYTLTNAQNREKLDTIYANDYKNVAMIFPKPISQGITGAKHFIFTYNREKEQHFGLLQAKPGEESNLLVICADGSIYSYIVTYKKQLSRLNYFIPETASIGNKKPLVINSGQDVKPRKDLSNKTDYYKRFCSYLLSKKQRIGRLRERRNGIILSIENIVFNKEQLYFVIHIENKSSLDYDLNFLKLSVETRQKGRRKSAQTLMKGPVFEFKIPVKLKEGQTAKMVYVFPKFSLSNDRRAVLELNEKAGERNLNLKISHRFINNPN